VNYIDLLIILVLILYAADGWVRGFGDKLVDLVVFLVSFLAALRWYVVPAELLMAQFQLSRHFAKAVGFTVMTIVASRVLGWGFSLVARRRVATGKEKPATSTESVAVDPQNDGGGKVVEERVEDGREWLKRGRRGMAVVLAGMDGLLFVALAVAFMVTFPLQPRVKTDIFASRIGQRLIAVTVGMENKLATWLGRGHNETLMFLTPAPVVAGGGTGQAAPIPLGVSLAETRLTVDVAAENLLRDLLLAVPAGAGEASRQPAQEELASLRELAKGMFVAGELFEPAEGYLVALAPAAVVAVEGLMSVEAYAFLLNDPNLTNISVGAVDGGAYGKIFVISLTRDQVNSKP